MRRVALAQAKAQPSALLDAIEAGEEVVITHRGRGPVARRVRERPQPGGSSDWGSRLRALHGDQPSLDGTAVALLRELRDQEP